MALGRVARELNGAGRDAEGADQVSVAWLSSLGFHDRHPGRAGFLRCWRSGSPPTDSTVDGSIPALRFSGLFQSASALPFVVFLGGVREWLERIGRKHER